MIAVKDLVKTFGTKRAVDGVTFTVRRGDILGFLGPNGAGKSTTMKIITGFLRPDSGRRSWTALTSPSIRWPSSAGSATCRKTPPPIPR